MWLLTIRGSSEWRYTTAAEVVNVTEANTGTVRTFWPGLTDPQPTESSDSTLGMELPISVLLSPEAWGAITGSVPLGWTAEVAWLPVGADWRAREVWVDGRVSKPVHETVDDPTSFTVTEVPWEDRSIFPPPSQQVNATTWGSDGTLSLPENTDGIWYPWVFGCPGFVYPTDDFTDAFGWPVTLVAVDTTTRNNFDTGAADCIVLIAGHVCGFSSVKLYNRTTGLSATVTTAKSTDLLNNVITVATVAGTDLQVSEGDELWASCVAISASGITTEDGRPLRGMGGIVRWLLEHSTIRFDKTKVSQLARLDRFKADFYVNDPASAFDIIQDNLLQNELLPAFWRRSSRGYFLAVRPFDTTTPEMQITAAEGWERDGGLTWSDDADTVTDATILYAVDAAQGITLRKIVYAPVPTSGATLNAYCASAYAALKYRKSVDLSAEAVQDPATAALLLDLAVRQRTTLSRSGAFVRQRTDGPEESGMVVSVTMPALNLDAVLCWITSVQHSVTESRITVETLSDQQRTGP